MVLNEVKTMAKTNKTQCQKGIKQVVLNKMKEPCRRVGESWTLREGFTPGHWLLAHNYYNWLFGSWLDGDKDSNGLVVVHVENVTYFKAWFRVLYPLNRGLPKYSFFSDTKAAISSASCAEAIYTCLIFSQLLHSMSITTPQCLISYTLFTTR